MKKAHIGAAALNENTPSKEASEALKSPEVHLLFTSPEYLLQNQGMKKLYVDEECRACVFSVLVDEAHVVHEWAEEFRKDYRELRTLQIILGDNVPWWALSATFTNEIFKKVYEALNFGSTRPFWGIDVGIDRPNLAQHIWPISDASTYRSLIQFIPKGAKTPAAILKTIMFFRSVRATRDACYAIRALFPPHLYNCIQPFSALNEESTKAQWLADLRDGCVRVLCCTIAAGMGCDIPDIEVSVIYGIDSFVSFVQKGGRAGRDGRIEAKMVWLMEGWMIDDEVGGKQAQDRWEKVDPMASGYVRCQMEGTCLRKFMNQALRPDPKTLDLLGFRQDNHGPSASWTVRDENVRPELGKCCSSRSCHMQTSGQNTDSTTDTVAEEQSTDSRHHLILNLLKHETSAAEDILGPPPGRGGIQCSEEDKEAFCDTLKQWRTTRWKLIRTSFPMLSEDWVLGRHNLYKLVDSIRRVLNTSEDKIDRCWIWVLIDTVADDATVDELSSVIRQFRLEFLSKRGGRKRPPRKQRKVSAPNSPRHQPDSTLGMSMQDSHLSPSCPQPRHHGPGETYSWDEPNQAEGPLVTVEVSYTSV